MIAFSPAKLNIGLHVTGKRPDGYHNIESIFVPIALYDAVELIPASHNFITTYGRTIPGEPEKNSCLTALQLLQANHNCSNYHIHLYKNIPIGAGLGGGSGNASAVLKLVNKVEALQLNNNELEEYALKIGSDNAFFIDASTKFVTGRGEILEPCSLQLTDYKVALVFPNVHMSTAKAYAAITPKQATINLRQLNKEQLFEAPQQIKNDFQDVFLEEFPETKSILELFNHTGSLYSSLTGSGSCFFGIYPPKVPLPKSIKPFAKKNGYQYFETTCL